MAVNPSEANSSTRQSNVRDADRDLIGIAFPFQRADGQFPKTMRNQDMVSNDLLTLFKTPNRSRVMRPLLGADIHRMVFESSGPLLTARLVRAVRQTIFLYEPRVKVLDIVVSEGSKLVDILIIYSVQGVKQTATVSISKAGVAT